MMSSAVLCLLAPPTLSLRNPSLSSSCLDLHQLFSSGIGFAGKVREQYQLGLPSARCNAIPKARVIQLQEALPNGFSVIERLDALPEVDEEEREESLAKVSEVDEIRCRVDVIRDMLNSMGDGEVSASAYDTAWVALVKDIDGSGAPQFPSSLQWILENQLSDGSWGDRHLFLAHDRIINTLACVIALKSWNVFPQSCDKGMAFISENMGKLEDEIAEHMPIGFEITFPSLIGIARSLGLEISFDSPVLEDIHAKRNLKLSRIPKEMMHKMPTTLLHSLEGLPADLDWGKLLKLQNQDGSFLFSPSSTAFALMETKDQKCLDYIQRVVERFKGGVPASYPIDMFEHIWAVDRLERLGISRYFELEIKTCLDYVFRYWTEDGIAWARNSRVQDVDDTAMGFRILRLHGYQVSADVLAHFEKDGEYFCFVGQSNQAVTGIFNLYRASQVMLPGEKILEDAKRFSYKFLREKQASQQLLDKWIITKDLPGEVGYALDFPWYASLPRVETRIYLQHYGGEDDVWIGKTLYRMPYVNNNIYLDLAKQDFNNCQELHQLEWLEMQKWYYQCSLGEYGLSETSVLRAYFLAAASIFEPGKATERLAWAQTAALLEAVSLYLGNGPCTTDRRRAFLNDFIRDVGGSKKTGKGLVGTLVQSLRHLSWEALLAHGRDVRYHLNQAWEKWLMGQWQEEEGSGEAELLVRTINLCAGRWVSEEVLSHPNYRRLTCATNKVCRQLRHLRETHTRIFDKGTIATRMNNHSIEEGMQEIVQGVLQSPDGIDSDIMQAFLVVSKSFYYYTHCSPNTFNIHIAKVLFERVA